jgi:hypothetical protein
VTKIEQTSDCVHRDARSDYLVKAQQ